MDIRFLRSKLSAGIYKGKLGIRESLGLSGILGSILINDKLK